MRTLKDEVQERGFPGVVAIDFDATISKYRGWQGKPTFPEPEDGCRQELAKLRERGYRIIVFTTRGDLESVEKYMSQHNLPYDSVNKNMPTVPPDVNDQKVMADVYIDDRNINYGGRWKGMADRVDAFQVHWRSPGARPFINLLLAGHPCDQISFYVFDINKAVDEYIRLGHTGWVRDTVLSRDVVSGKEFVVDLAFNYTVMPVEFELLSPAFESAEMPPHLEYMFRASQQLQFTQGLSHLGFHTSNAENVAVELLNDGHQLLADVTTIKHSGCDHKYRYLFFDTADKYGFHAKFIQRLI